MSADFIGLTVLITLKNPPATFVGCVADVRNNQLYLQDVHYPDSGGRLKELMVKGADIADLEIVQNTPGNRPPSHRTSVASTQPTLSTHEPVRQPNITPVPRTASASSKALRFLPASVVRPPPSTQPAFVPTPAQPQPQPQADSGPKFVDPAILSYTRNQPALLPSRPPYPTPVGDALAMPITPDPVQTHGLAIRTTVPAHQHHKPSSDKIYDYVVVDNDTKQEEVEEVTVIKADSRRDSPRQAGAIADPPTDKKKPRIKSKVKPKRKKREEAEELAVNNPSSPELTRAEPGGSGWRETPIIDTSGFPQEPETDANPVQTIKHLVVPSRGIAKGKLKKMSRREREKFEAQTGWATEDGATDVQELPDFDFADNLSKFDKKAVFQQLAAEDDTAIEDRLVSFNRVSKPGTFGGTKYHPLENVLGNGKQTAQDADEFDEDDPEYENLAASQMSIRSRTMSNRAPSRKGSKYDGYISPPSVNDQSSHQHRSLSIVKASNHVAFDSDSRMNSPALPTSTPRSNLRYSNNNRTCPVVTPETLSTVEDVASTQFSMSKDLITENAGRSIAVLALKAINPGGQRLATSNHNTRPVVVVLAGMHVNGARAIAAARHLAERGVRIIITSPCNNPTHKQSPLAKQARRLGGDRAIIRAWKETSAYLKTLDAPPELIIDALSGPIHPPFVAVSEDMPATQDGFDGAADDFDDEAGDAENTRTAIQMMHWANASAASVLAVDRPAGIDAVTGLVEILNGEPLEIRAKLVVACGAPSIGLSQALSLRKCKVGDARWSAEGIGSGVDWKVFVADVGLGLAGREWARSEVSSGRSERWVRFGGEWIVAVELARGGIAGGPGEAGLVMGMEGRSSRRSMVVDSFDAYD